MKRNFEYKTLKSNGQRLVVACSVDGCKWYIRALTISSTQVWVIRGYAKDHTCTVDVVCGDHRQATSLIISECVKQKVIDGECNDMKSIIKHMRKEFGVGVSYYKSWRANELVLEAIQGCLEDSYTQLPSLCYALSYTNLGTVTDIEDGGNGHFKYFFVSFAASIEGWSHCRPIISIDGTFLRNKYAGTLQIACTMDGNNSIFLLAFAVIDSKTDVSWEWFMYKLKSNIRTKFKHPSVVGIFNHYARVYKFSDFEHEMKKLDQAAPGIRDYLLDVGYEKWSHCYSMRRRSNDVNEFTTVHGKSSFIVYLEIRSCSCRKWDFEEIPCFHACAVISKQ
ncbi:uncharacterized protein LOC129292447 [Prosopis cineraria]|uniref:uncharacterized protein LOC129292447 n=1 Tax=Prosopis cineraria TaxID=364024 RepID=UPI00240EC5C7|nr:uncharacterized protein LOC129292447 [Prosopis cineraria]